MCRYSRLRFQREIWEIAQDQFVAINRGLDRRGRSAGERRSGGRNEQRRRHFGNTDVTGETGYVKPVCDGEITESHEDGAGDHEPKGNNWQESKRKRKRSTSDAEGDKVSQASTDADRQHRTEMVPRK